MRTSSSDTDAYKGIVKRALSDESVFAVFKRDRNYTKVLEHVSYELGYKYLQIIKRDNPQLMEKIDEFKKNDLLGSPNKYYYEGIGDISPTTLRYIKVLSDILKMNIDLNNKDIIEIGPGYGGQCLIISMYFKYHSYCLVDLASPLFLARKYLKLHNISNLLFREMHHLKDDTEYYFALSNYAFTECNNKIQDVYFEKVFKNSHHGYITVNSPDELSEVDQYKKEDIINLFNWSDIQNEDPLTSKNNIILIW